MVEILPFMFNASYFAQDHAVSLPIVFPPVSLPIVFPPVSLAVPMAVPTLSIPAKTEEPSQKMFHCGNKTHDSLFVCFYVLKNKTAMLYHRDARRWPMLERQHKIELAATLRDTDNVRRLNDMFPKKGAAKIGQLDDELTNQKNLVISVKTFVSLCCIYCINIVLIDDDLHTMCILQNDFNNAFPKHSVHIRAGNSCIMWNNDLDVLKQRTEGYETISPADTTFDVQLCSKASKKIKSKEDKSDVITNKNLKAITAYKTEELQAMCIARDICCSKIAGTGKGNKILKIDLYNSILQKMGV